MNIGIDIDDTITDSFEYLMKCVAEYFNYDINYLKENNFSYNNLPKNCKKYEYDFAKKYYDKSLPHIPLKEGAREYIKKIKKLGHNIFIITARNTNMYKDPYISTKKQLEINNIYYDKLFCTFDKVSICKTEKVDLVIDDSIENCIAINNIGIDTLLFNSVLNEKQNVNIKRVRNWKEIFEYIKKTRTY